MIYVIYLYCQPNKREQSLFLAKEKGAVDVLVLSQKSMGGILVYAAYLALEITS